MNVKVYCFEWAVGSDTSVKDFLNYLKSENGIEKDNVILAVVEHGEYWAGVLITIKNRRAYFQFQKRGEGFQVSVRKLEEGTSIVDLNFFILHPDTGKGLYQHYHHSAYLSTFEHICAHRYVLFKTIYRLKGRLKQAILLKPDSIEHYAEKMKLIKKVVVEFTSATYSEQEFRPVAAEATRVVHKAVFDQRWQQNPRAIKQAVVDFFRKQKEKLNRATVTGIDGNGVEVNYKLLNDPDVYLEYNYDDFIQDVTLDTKDLESTIKNADCIARLLQVAEQDGVKQLLKAKSK